MKQTHLFRTNLLLLFIAGVIASSCEKSKDKSEFDPQMLVYSLNVALVPGSMEKLTVCAYNGDGKKEALSVTCDNPGIASATLADTIVTVTGLSYGSTKVSFKSASGKTSSIPVKVYDPQVLETDELLISFSTTYQLRWNPAYTMSYWHPVVTNGFKPLGSLGIASSSNPDGKYAVMVVKGKSGSNALAAPIDYTLLVDGSSDNQPDINVSFWIPVPPAGYKAMGIVAQTGFAKPPLTDVICVREDLTIPGEAGALIYGHNLNWTSSGYTTLFCWRTEPPLSLPHEDAYLSTGTFVATSPPTRLNVQPPLENPVMRVLKIKLPMLAETPYQNYVPFMTGYERPPDETIPILAREMLVPCTIVNDPQFTGDNGQMLRIANSPFYRLERQVFYKLLGSWHNTTSIVQHNSYTKSYGLSAAASQTLYNETAISISAETGISFKMASAKISATVSKSFGYASMTSVTELTEETYESGIDCPPERLLLSGSNITGSSSSATTVP